MTRSYNPGWIIVLSAALFLGCATNDDDDKPISTVRLHAEEPDMGVDRTMEVPILRSNPVTIEVNKEWFLHEAYLEGAKVVDTPGGHMISLKFNRSGAWVLEARTANLIGKHVAVYGQFGYSQSRWFAAPRITKRITNGVFNFTPDADLEESTLFVDGLNHLLEKRKKQWQSD